MFCPFDYLLDELPPDEPFDPSFGGIVSPFKICMSDILISEEKQPYNLQKQAVIQKKHYKLDSCNKIFIIRLCAFTPQEI